MANAGGNASNYSGIDISTCVEFACFRTKIPKNIRNRVYMHLFQLCTIHYSCTYANQQAEYPHPIFMTYILHFGYAMTLNIWVISRCVRNKRLRMPKPKGQVVVLVITVLGFFCILAWTFSLQVGTRTVLLRPFTFRIASVR